MLENLEANVKQSVKCKAKIIELVFTEWKNQSIPSDFSIFLGRGFSEKKSVVKLQMDEVPVTIAELKSTHEEADTRIVFHVASCLRNGSSKVIVRANDTDIIVILLQHYQWLALLSQHQNPKLFEVSRKNNSSSLCGKIGTNIIVSSMAILHCFSDCDTTFF